LILSSKSPFLINISIFYIVDGNDFNNYNIDYSTNYLGKESIQSYSYFFRMQVFCE